MLINQRGTAIQSNIEEEASGRKLTQCDRVLKAIKDYGSLSDRRISQITGIPLQLIPDRRGKLLKDGKVIEYIEVMDYTTGKMVMLWQLNPSPTIPFRKKSAQQKTFEIKQLCKSSDSELAKKILNILNQ